MHLVLDLSINRATTSWQAHQRWEIQWCSSVLPVRVRMGMLVGLTASRKFAYYRADTNSVRYAYKSYNMC